MGFHPWTVHIQLLDAEPIHPGAVAAINELGSQHVSIEAVRPLPFGDVDDAVVELEMRLWHESET
jgi:hypothetical protein